MGLSNATVIAQMKVDEYFQERIWRTWGLDVAHGVTNWRDVQGRVKQFIVEHGIAAQWVNPKARSRQPRSTWSEAYERGYREKLDP
jgi:hypothetical protein